MFDEYADYDATGLAGLVESGLVTASELCETAIDAIEQLDPTANFLIAERFAQARQEAVTPSGPLAGVPWLLKDLNTNCAGLPSINGTNLASDEPLSADSELVRRHKAAGLVILGKTNTPEFGMDVCTAPTRFGPTPNPFDPSRSAGGSSGGSAAAVALGVVPAAHGTDSGGSIRIPASNCGLFGLKPTRGRIPLGNDASEGLAGLSTAHALTHSVRDSALVLDLTAGPLHTDGYAAPAASGFLAAIADEQLVAPLPRVALWLDGFAGEPIDPSCQEAAQLAAAAIESLGGIVEISRPDFDGQLLRDALSTIFSVNIAAAVQATGIANAESLVEPATRAAIGYAKTISSVEYVEALATVRSVTAAVGEFFTRFDVLLTPTLAAPPLPLGFRPKTTPDWPSYVMAMLDEIPFTPLFNVTGGPAASLPLHSVGGLPVGVQIGAGLGQEATLLRLSRLIEKAKPWHQRR